MGLDNRQIAAAFCSWRFAETYACMADEIRWNTVGREEAVGREAVIARCAAATQFLATVSASITRLDTIQAETGVIVEAAAEFKHSDHHVSSVASCDIFRFSGEQLIEITSYVVELDKA